MRIDVFVEARKGSFRGLKRKGIRARKARCARRRRHQQCQVLRTSLRKRLRRSCYPRVSAFEWNV